MTRLTLLLALFVVWGFVTGVAPQDKETIALRDSDKENSDRFVIKPYLQRMTQDGVTVLWETVEGATSVVEYGAARIGDTTPNLSQHVDTTDCKTVHAVRLSGLEPETAYFHRVRCKTEAGRECDTEIRTFKTAVRADSPFLLAAFSDSQDNPEVWQRVTRHAYNERPDFGIHAGDLVGVGAKKSDWTDEFFPPAHHFMSRIPLFTILGNHEGDAPYYYKYFDNPSPEYYYTFDYGNARFFMLDSCRPVTRRRPPRL